MIEMYLNVLVSSDVEVSNALVEGTGTGKLSDLKQHIFLKDIYCFQNLGELQIDTHV